MKLHGIMMRAHRVKNDRDENHLYYDVLLAIARGVCLDPRGAAMAALHSRARGDVMEKRRNPKDDVLTVRAPEELLNSFKKYAKEHDTSVSELLRLLMEAAIKGDPSVAPCFNKQSSG